MAPLVLEGKTLGEKRKHYNRLVIEAITNNTVNEISPINFDEEDIDNLFKIDIACENRNVKYVLEVFKCEDMLYVSRAIKQSTWLITDDQYAHIINPEYLFNELFSHMTSKAKTKLLLHIRLNLKDERRVDEFCNYLMSQNLKIGIKWLPHCSDTLIEETIEKHSTEIPTQLMKRLCRRSIKFFEIYLRKNCYAYDVAQATLFLLNKNAEKYLEIVHPKKQGCQCTPQFGPKPTRKIMKKCPQKIINEFEVYAKYINIRTFAKFIKENDLKEFIVKHLQNNNLHCILKPNIHHFLQNLPSEEKFEFVKTYFIDKSHKENNDLNDEVVAYSTAQCYFMRESAFTSANVYNWYKFAPFTIAFKDIKKLIKTESNPRERNSMLAVILQCAGKNMQDIQTLVHHYRENHINEPFKFKVHFVNSLLSKIDLCSIDLTTWGHINDIFTSMEVYEDSSNDVHTCVKYIIIYNLVHNKPITKIIENKFKFDTLKTYQTKLGHDHREKVFNYLYNHQLEKFNKLTLTNEREFAEASILLENVLNLLKDWKKNLSEYATLLENVKKLINTKKDADISKFYQINKSWRKLLFNESLLINPIAEVAINALKHEPELINIYEKEVLVICLNENKRLSHFLNRIRIFWSQSLASTFKKKYFDAIEKKTNCSASMFGLSILLSRREFLQLVHEHVPADAKIDWTQLNEFELSIRRNLAKRLHFARPQPPLSSVLLYAKGDYLQYVLPSLNSILYNISSDHARDHIKSLLKTPVSLQKHVIRIAIHKLQHDELKVIFTDLWNSTKNSSIRADVMKQTFNLLCKQQNADKIEETWNILKIFIDNLTADENKNIYATLCRVKEVPSSIKADFWMKSYQFFKGLPEKANGSDLIGKLKHRMTDVIESLDPDFIANMYLESFDKNFTKQLSYDINYLTIYLLSSKTIEIQNTRYNKVLLPIMEKAINSWDLEHKGSFYTRSNLIQIFKSMFREFEEYVLNKNMVLPVDLLNKVHQKLNKDLPIRKNYPLITFLKLSHSYVKILDEILKTKSRDAFKDDSSSSNNPFDWKLLRIEAAPKFAKICLEYLEMDVKIFFPSIYVFFAYALEGLFSFYETESELILLKSIVEHEIFSEGYLLVLRLLPHGVFEEKAKSLKSEILNKIKDHPCEEVNMHCLFYEESY